MKGSLWFLLTFCGKCARMAPVFDLIHYSKLCNQGCHQTGWRVSGCNWCWCCWRSSPMTSGHMWSWSVPGRRLLRLPTSRVWRPTVPCDVRLSTSDSTITHAAADSVNELLLPVQSATLGPTRCCQLPTTRRIVTCRCFLPSQCQSLVLLLINARTAHSNRFLYRYYFAIKAAGDKHATYK